MMKAQSVYTSKKMNRKAKEEVKATRREHSEIVAMDLALATEHRNDHFCYVNVNGMAIPTGC